MGRVTRQARKKKRKRIIYWVLIIIAAAAGLAVSHIYDKADTAIDKMYVEVAPEAQGPKVSVQKSEPLNVLLLGADTGELGREGRGLSDTMMIATLNPETESTTIVSLPRDTYVEMGVGDQNKLNAAYAMGGASQSIEVISDLLDIPIHRYIAVDMGGLVKVIDILGGIEVDNDFYFEIDGYYFDEGKVTLDGEQTMMYVRMRYDDPRGDYGRQERQRDVVQAIIKKAVSLNTVWNFEDLFQTLSDHVSTNLTMNEITTMVSKYLGCGKNIHTDQLQGEGAMIDGLSFQIVDDSEIERVHNLIVGQLD